MRAWTFVALGLALLPLTAQAQERDYCPDRPGLNTPACTMAPGRASLEVAVGDWTLERDAQERQDTFVLGDALLRYGIAQHAEVQVGWTSLGFVRTRDRLSGAIDHRSGVGDVTVALRRNLANPDGSGLALAVMPFATLPVGHEPIGDGTWSAGVLVPASYELSDSWSLAATSEIDAAADEDGHGRHFAFSQAVGASAKLAKALTATAEYQLTVDRETADRHLEHLAGLSLAWQPGHDLQLDLGTNIGLDADAPDAEVYLGVSRRF